MRSDVLQRARQENRKPRRAGTALSPVVPSPAAGLRRSLGNHAFASMSRAIQAKLTVGAPNDRFEREADRVADQVMRMPLPKGAGLSGVPQGIQRSCAACAAGATPCAKCGGEEQEIQRKPLAATITPLVQRQEAAPEEDEDHTLQAKAASGQAQALGAGTQGLVTALQGGGQPLAAAQRGFFEPRFGANFSAVRIHSDARAATAARSIGARAYTLGRDVVFGQGEFRPESPSGRRLLAHELTHTIQQGGARGMARPTPGAGGAVPAVARAPDPRVQRQDDDDVIPIDLVPVSPEEAERLAEQGINLPTVSATTWRLIGGVGNHSGEPLAPQERENIESHLTARSVDVPTTQALGSTLGPLYILHDTAADVGPTTIGREQRENRGPLGRGVAAWVPRSDPLAIARPNFFETERPTTSEFEKASDVIAQAPREAAFRQVWAATSGAQQSAAMTRALNALGLTAAEMRTESTNATTQLNASSGMIFTAGSWAVREICNAVSAVRAAAVARSPATEADLVAGCQTLQPYFAARNQRVGASVNVELVQSPGSNCSSTGTLVALRPYTTQQYQGAVTVYLRAALAAGRFPGVTTHFWVDRAARGHCDPRCFDLGRFYRMITTALGHGRGSSYGDAPNYGVRWGTNNVWWQNTVCGGAPP